MDWFGWKARRETARPVLARGWAVGQGAESLVPGDYAARVRAAYADNAVAQRCVRLLTEAVGSAPVIVEGGEGSGSPTPPPSFGWSPSPFRGGPDAKAVALVAARSNGQALLATVAAQLLLHGNAYVQIIEGADGGPGELYALRPERVAIEVDAGGWPVAFGYRVGPETVRLLAEDARGRTSVVHVKLHHPLDDHYGLGCLSAAAGAVAAHNLAGQWNRALLANAARPSGALVYDPGEKGATMTAAQFERLNAEMSAQYAGARNAGRPLLLEGGLKWQAMSLSPADMDFLALKDSAAREIACAFGVPPMLVGIPGDATYANYREATKALWRESVLPLAGTILEGISQGLASWGFAGRMTVDLNKVTALSEDRERLWSMVSAADFLSDAEKRALVGV